MARYVERIARDLKFLRMEPFEKECGTHLIDTTFL